MAREKEDLRQTDELGRVSGKLTAYHKDGTIFFTEEWARGERHGWHEYTWGDGKPSHRGYYIYGKKHGYWKEWNWQGSLTYSGYYDMGTRCAYATDVRDKLLEKILE